MSILSVMKDNFKLFNQNTWGHGDLSNGIDIHDNHYLNAQMHIQNATNFEVGISINGMSGIGDVGMSRFLRLNIFRPRSSALICAVSEQKPQTRYQHLVFGERKHGDFIVHASKNSFNGTESHLPRHQIEFQDNNVVLTSVSIRLNVSIYLYQSIRFVSISMYTAHTLAYL